MAFTASKLFVGCLLATIAGVTCANAQAKPEESRYLACFLNGLDAGVYMRDTGKQGIVIGRMASEDDVVKMTRLFGTAARGETNMEEAELFARGRAFVAEGRAKTQALIAAMNGGENGTVNRLINERRNTQRACIELYVQVCRQAGDGAGDLCPPLEHEAYKEAAEGD